MINSTQNVIRTNKNIVETFDLTNQDVAQTGSICGGSTTILIEPFTKELKSLIKSIIADTQLDNNILVTSISNTESVTVERQRITKDYHLVFPNQVVNIINLAIEHGNSNSVLVDDRRYLIQNIGRQPILHIFGAGHVGKAVSDLANFAELNAKIYDERKDLANNERFPFALQISNVEISELVNKTNIAQSDYVLVATRGHQHDFELMRWLLTIDIDYLSLMSSNKKWQLLSEALIKDGFSEEQLNKVHSPVGLDIGSETVPEIAVSVIAEIINHSRKREKSKISLSI